MARSFSCFHYPAFDFGLDPQKYERVAAVCEAEKTWQHPEARQRPGERVSSSPAAMSSPSGFGGASIEAASMDATVPAGSPEQGLQTLPTRGLRPRRGAGTRAC